MVMTVCPYVSSAPYIIGCDDGYLILLPTSVKCETRCAAWKDDHCIRLMNGQSGCKCGEVANCSEN